MKIFSVDNDDVAQDSVNYLLSKAEHYINKTLDVIEDDERFLHKSLLEIIKNQIALIASKNKLTILAQFYLHLLFIHGLRQLIIVSENILFFHINGTYKTFLLHCM